MPGARPLKSSVRVPLLHKKLYGPVPPVGVKFIEPLFAPKQVMLVDAIVVVSCDGCVTVIVRLVVQPLLSVMPTE